jgi:hypothetical protein
MKWSILILTLFTASFCNGQDSIFICKEKNLLVPEGYIVGDKLRGSLSECKDAEAILEGYDYLFTGFEKYGYTLELDTSDVQYLGVNSRIIGYFDLVNNTDSIINVCGIGAAGDMIVFGRVLEDYNVTFLEPGDSIKIKYTLFRGLWRINRSFDKPLIPDIKNENFIVPKNKIKYINHLHLLKRLKHSNECFCYGNSLYIIRGNYFRVAFRIPAKYIRDIKYY